MKHLSNRYAKIMEYKGMDICSLRVATPSNGDELGYKIDDILYDGMVFADLGEAMKAIDFLGIDEGEEDVHCKHGQKGSYQFRTDNQHVYRGRRMHAQS